MKTIYQHKTQQQGASMIGLLIAIVVIITISACGVMLVSHYFNRLSKRVEIADSVQTLKNAATTYYFDEINTKKIPDFCKPGHTISSQPNIQNLIKKNYLDTHATTGHAQDEKLDLYWANMWNPKLTKKQNKAFFKHYDINIACKKSNYNPPQITITVSDTQPLPKFASANITKQSINHAGEKTNEYTYHTTWTFVPMIDLYHNRMNNQVVQFNTEVVKQ